MRYGRTLPKLALSTKEEATRNVILLDWGSCWNDVTPEPKTVLCLNIIVPYLVCYFNCSTCFPQEHLTCTLTFATVVYTSPHNGQLESIEGYVWLCIQASHAAKWLACEQVGEWQCHRKPPKQWYKTGSSLLSENTFRTFVEAVGLVPCLPRTRSWPDIHRPLIELNDHDLDCACQAHVSSVSGEKEMQTKMQDLKDSVSRLNG